MTPGEILEGDDVVVSYGHARGGYHAQVIHLVPVSGLAVVTTTHTVRLDSIVKVGRDGLWHDVGEVQS